MGRRFECPVEKHQAAYVVLPDEWLGKHALKRDEAVRSSAAHNNTEITNLTIAITLVDEWSGIPGMEGRDPAQWKPEETPLSIIAWLTRVVITDFNAAFYVPKNSSRPSPAGPSETPEAAAMANP